MLYSYIMPKVTQKYKQEPFDKMLRRFRNQVERAGIVKRVRELEFYEKPSAIKNQRNQSIKRKRKKDAMKAERLDQIRRQSRLR